MKRISYHTNTRNNYLQQSSSHHQCAHFKQAYRQHTSTHIKLCNISCATNSTHAKPVRLNSNPDQYDKRQLYNTYKHKYATETQLHESSEAAPAYIVVAVSGGPTHGLSSACGGSLSDKADVNLPIAATTCGLDMEDYEGGTPCGNSTWNSMGRGLVPAGDPGSLSPSVLFLGFCIFCRRVSESDVLKRCPYYSTLTVREDSRSSEVAQFAANNMHM